LQILRFLSLNEPQFLGCLSAFLETLEGEFQSATSYLQRLVDRPKGSSFGFEMQLDKHRYGAMITLDRWSTFAAAFAPSAVLKDDLQEMLTGAAARVKTSSDLLDRTNHMIDASDTYSGAVIEACGLAFRTVQLTFQQEQKAATQARSLGPMLPEDYQHYRSVFLGDLAIR